MDSQRREFTRVPLAFPVELVVGDQTFPAAPINVSAAGVLLEPLEAKLEGREVQLRILVDPRTTLTMWGEVVRQTAENAALRFTRVEALSFCFLREYIRMHADNPDLVEQEFNEHSGILARIQ